MKKFLCALFVIALSLTLLGCTTTGYYEPTCEHDFDSEIIKDATATENGTKELTCKLCGEKETQSFSMLERMKELGDILLSRNSQSIKSKLLNPNSYTVNSETIRINHDKKNNRYFMVIDIDYSAQNRIGGYARASERFWYCWRDTAWGFESVPGVVYGSDEYYDIATIIVQDWYRTEYIPVAFFCDGEWQEMIVLDK